jgi:putative ABC transport system permease protein
MGTFRYAARTLVKWPGFTALALTTLALGIGANTAVFSLLRAILLAPLPISDVERVVTIMERRSSSRAANLPVSAHEYVAWKERTSTLQSIALMLYDMADLTGGGQPEKVQVLRVSSEYFPLLGIAPVRGRVFAPGEDRAGYDRVVILSHSLWQRRFNEREDAVGSRVRLNDQTYEVVGVMPPLPRGLTADVWTPLDVPGHVRAVGRHNLNVVGRLRDGVGLEAARSDVSAVSAQLSKERPASNTNHDAVLMPLREALVGDFRRAIFTLAAAAGFVLLIACANVMNLLLTRGAGRQRELAVRVALGATRGRLVRDLLAESLLISLVGGALGVLLATWIVDAIPGLRVVDIPLLDTARIDWQALAVAATLAIATGLGSGIAPALRGARQQETSLRDGDRTSDDPRRRRLRSGLVAVETALALVLLAGAGLMLRSFVKLMSVDPGFTTERVLTVPISLPAARYADATQQRAFYDRLLTALKGAPGVEAAGAVSHLPLGGADNWMMFQIVGQPRPGPGAEPNAPFRTATPDYFRVMGIPLVRGRFFTEADARIAVPVVRWYPQQPYPEGFDKPQAPPIAIISEAAAHQFFPNADPIGQRIRVIFGPEMTIVGVVGNVKHNGLNAPAFPHIYLPHNQEVWNSASFVVKTAAAPEAIASSVRAIVASLDPDLPISVRSMEDVRFESVGQPRLYALLVTSFAAVALGLAVVGIFGVVSHAVTQRTREIGVRVALGAGQRTIERMVVTDGMRPIAVGVILGTVGALALTRTLDKLLFGLEPTDPVTFVGAVLVLSTFGLAACWLPARRAARLDPVAALRAQ